MFTSLPGPCLLQRCTVNGLVDGLGVLADGGARVGSEDALRGKYVRQAWP